MSMRRIALLGGAAGLVLVPIAAGLGFIELHAQTGGGLLTHAVRGCHLAEYFSSGYDIKLSL